MTREVTVLYGPPGTGKTTRLLGIMEQEIASGVAPEEIAFVSFTKAAVTEATTRARTKFNASRDDLRWFRTLHSLAFAALGLTRGSVMSDHSEFALENGFSFAKRKEGLDAVFSERSGDEILSHANGLCRATGKSLEDVIKQFRLNGVLPGRYETFCERLAAWKKTKGQVDYADMISMFIARNVPLGVKVALVDEAQDLTPQQWAMVLIAFRDVDRLYIAGDDDQAIYQWAGADALRMLRSTGRQIVLDQSYRLPKAIHAFANQIASRIETRKAKEWKSTTEEGALTRSANLSALPLDNGERWMLLARTGMSLPAMARHCEQRGIPHCYNGESAVKPEEVEVYKLLATIRAGAKPTLAQVRTLQKFGAPPQPWYDETLFSDGVMLSKLVHPRRRFLAKLEARGLLSAKPLVDISTIHRVKGAEADNVVLSPELSRATHDALRSPNYSDSEHRVWYVGATRAKKRLLLLRPEAEFSYSFPSGSA